MCACSDVKKNQTRSDAFDYAEPKGEHHLGFGVFLVPAPEKGILEYKTVRVEGLTYSDTVKRGSNCLAFQWVPEGIEAVLKSGQKVSVKTLKDLENLTRDCGRCPRCQYGCFCWVDEVGGCHT